MAVRLKDRIEANIRQSDKVNNSLSIQLNSGTATVYNGSTAKSINITPAAIGASTLKIALNGTSAKNTGTFSFYAPSTSPQADYYELVSNGYGVAPKWEPRSHFRTVSSTAAMTDSFVVNADGTSAAYEYYYDYDEYYIDIDFGGAEGYSLTQSKFGKHWKVVAYSTDSLEHTVTVNIYPYVYNKKLNNNYLNTIDIAHGGTGATTAEQALINLGVTGLVSVAAIQPTEEKYTLWVDTSEDSAEAMRADAIKYKTFSIATSAWSGSGPYTYSMTATGVTANTAIINLTLDAASQTYQKAQLDWETGANIITLSTATKPTGTLTGYLIAAQVTEI